MKRYPVVHDATGFVPWYLQRNPLLFNLLSDYDTPEFLGVDMPNIAGARKCPKCGVLAVRHPNTAKGGIGEQASLGRCLNAECPKWEDWPKREGEAEHAA